MALAIDDHISTLILSSMTTSTATGNTMNQNVFQGLALTQTYLLCEHAGVSDDASLLASLQAAAGSPEQGKAGK